MYDSGLEFYAKIACVSIDSWEKNRSIVRLDQGVELPDYVSMIIPSMMVEYDPVYQSDIIPRITKTRCDLRQLGLFFTYFTFPISKII